MFHTLLDNILYTIALVTLTILSVNIFRDYTGHVGTTLEKVWASARKSATIAVTRIGNVLAALGIIAPQIASGLKDNPEISDSVKQLFDLMHSAQYYAIYTIVLFGIISLARSRTLGKSNSNNSVNSTIQEIQTNTNNTTSN